MMVTDYSDLMAYADTYEKVDAFLDKFKAIIKRHPEHEAKPVIELDPDVKNDSINKKYMKKNIKRQIVSETAKNDKSLIKTMIEELKETVKPVAKVEKTVQKKPTPKKK